MPHQDRDLLAVDLEFVVAGVEQMEVERLHTIAAMIQCDIRGGEPASLILRETISPSLRPRA